MIASLRGTLTWYTTPFNLPATPSVFAMGEFHAPAHHRLREHSGQEPFNSVRGENRPEQEQSSELAQHGQSLEQQTV